MSAVRLGGRPTKVTVSDQFTSAVSTLGAVTVTPAAPVQTCLTADLLNNGCLLTAPANGQLILNEERAPERSRALFSLISPLAHGTAPDYRNRFARPTQSGGAL